MAIKKFELYAKLWASCDELRGGMDASSYKGYVLDMLFVKYVSDKYAGQLFGAIKVPEGASFDDMNVEIMKWETQWNKAGAIKQGMMHSLLTGKIRLV